MERYEAYKDSGVKWIGGIPEGWETTVFSRACNASLGKMLTNVPKTDVSFAAPYLKAANLQEDGFALQNLQSMYFEPDEAEQYGLDKGDLLVVEGGSVGLAHLWDGSIDNCYIQNALHRVRPREGFSVQYLKYCLDAARNSGYIDLVCNKATIAHFTKEKLLATPLAVPPLAEQQAIADFLDAETARIDGLVADCEREVELLQEYRKAVISEAVTKGLDPHAPMKDSGVEWIGKIPEEWSVVSMRRCIIRTGNGMTRRGDYDEAGTWVLKLRNIGNGKIDSSFQSRMILTERELSTFKLEMDDFLFVRVNGSRDLIGKSAIYKSFSENAVYNDHIIRIKFDNQYCLPPFMLWYLQSDSCRREIDLKVKTSAGQFTVSSDDIKECRFVMPPLAEQREIVAYLDVKTAEIDELIEAKRQMAKKLREYRKSLISEAVTGKFKVPGVA